MKQLIAALLLALCPSLSSAAAKCEPVARHRHLVATFGETVQARAMSNGVLVEIYANLETGSWSYLTVYPNGISCIENFGAGFYLLRPEPDPPNL